ncbi:MAG: chromosome segregation ATPase, partial [Halobacteriales archaeon]
DVESELETLQERVDSLERTVEAERSERRDLAESVDRLEERLDERAPSDRVASLADAVESLESDLDELSDDVAENAEWREQVASAFAESGVGHDSDRE